MYDGGSQSHWSVSEGVTQGHCGVSEEGGYKGQCLVETRHFRYDADFVTLFITFIFLFYNDSFL